MKSINKVELLGNLGQDAEIRTTTNGTTVASFSLATTESYKNTNGDWVDNTTWHNVVLYKPSEHVQKNLKKGSKLFVEGKISKRDYDNKDGNKVYVTEVIARDIILLDNNSSSNASSSVESVLDDTDLIDID